MKKGLTSILKTNIRILSPSIFFLLIAFVSTGISGTLEIHFIDVGQGDSIFIITPNQKTILIDAGVHSVENDRRNPFNYIRSLKETGKIKDLNIDLALITHADDDHYGGFKYLCRDPGGGQDFSIENIYYSVFESAAYGKRFWPCLEVLIKKADYAGQVSARGPPINPDPEIELKVLYPFQKLIKRHTDKNDDSVVILLKYQKTKFLFPGDASKRVEEQLIEKYNQELQSNVLKLGHHGARTASTKNFLTAVNSGTEKFHAVISANDKDGRGKGYGHPHAETLNTLEGYENVELYRTDLHGTITMISNGNSIKVNTSNQKEVSKKNLWKPGKKRQ